MTVGYGQSRNPKTRTVVKIPEGEEDTYVLKQIKVDKGKYKPRKNTPKSQRKARKATLEALKEKKL